MNSNKNIKGVKFFYLTPLFLYGIIAQVIEMDKILNQSLLFDFYGELLNDNQRKIYELYIFENLSLAEIAECEGISRQGVYDSFKRCSNILNNYEEKLHLVERYLSYEETFKNLKNNIQEYRKTGEESLLDTIEGTVDNILGEW